MPVSPTFEFKFYKNPDSEQCKNIVKVIPTYVAQNRSRHENGGAIKITNIGRNTTLFSNIVLNANEFINDGVAQPPIVENFIQEVLYNTNSSWDIQNAMTEIKVDIKSTGLFTIELLLCSTINEPDYDFAVSVDEIFASSGGQNIQFIDALADCFILRMNNGKYRYFIRTGGAGTSFSLFTEVNSYEDIPEVSSNGRVQKCKRYLLNFCKYEKSLNCSIQKFNDKIIDNIDAVSICKESDCECGNVKDVVKGWIITQFFYNFIQRHVSDDIVDIKYESLIAVDITDENENKVKDILNRYSALMCCKGSCSDC